MDRRTLVAQVGTVVAAGLAGCVADEDGGDNEDTPDESETGTSVDQTPGNGTTTEAEGEETAPPPATEITLNDASLTAVDAGCGQQHDEAQVAFEHDDGEVDVTGTIWGSDLCKVPELVDAWYDAQADELAVTIGTTERDSDETPACGQCITELDYRVTASFDGGLPGSVTVTHVHGEEREEVATASQS